jgi:hypothetical protein
MKKYFSASRSYKIVPETPQVSAFKWSTSPKWLKSYFPMIDFEILALDIFDKRRKSKQILQLILKLHRFLLYGLDWKWNF